MHFYEIAAFLKEGQGSCELTFEIKEVEEVDMEAVCCDFRPRQLGIGETRVRGLRSGHERGRWKQCHRPASKPGACLRNENQRGNSQGERYTFLIINFYYGHKRLQSTVCLTP